VIVKLSDVDVLESNVLFLFD